MNQREQVALPPAQGIPVHHPEVHPDTFGQYIIDTTKDATDLALYADKGDLLKDRIDELSAEKYNPRFNGPAEQALSNSGIDKPAMTEAEMTKLDEAMKFYEEEYGNSRFQASWKREQVSKQLDDLRAEMRQLLRGADKDDIYKLLEPYLSRFQRQQIKDRYQWGADPSDYFVKLLTRAKYKTMPVANRAQREAREAQRTEDDQRLLNFIQAHYQTVRRRQQDPEFKANVETQKEIWTTGVKKGVKEGWLDDDAADRPSRLHNIKVYEGDIISTFLRERGGYHNRGTNNVVVAPGQIKYATVHELNHALLEGYDIRFGEKSFIDLPLVGEPLTEHIAQVMRGRTDIDTLVPDRGAYEEELELLADIIQAVQERGVGLTVRDFTRAYSARGENRRHQAEVINQKIRSVLTLAGERGEKIDLFTAIHRRVNQTIANPEFMPSLHGRAREAAAVTAIRQEFQSAQMEQERRSELVGATS